MISLRMQPPMKMIRFFSIAIGMAVSLLALAGCGGTQSTPSQPPPTQNATQVSQIATLSAMLTPKATMRPLPSPTNTINLAKTLCFGKGLLLNSAWSPDGKVFAVASSIGVYLYDGATFQALRFLDTSMSISSMAFNPDGQTLAVGGSDGLQIWEVNSGQLLQIGLNITNGINGIVFSPNGQMLAAITWGEKSTVWLWDIKTGQKLNALVDEHQIRSIAFSADGKLLMTYDGTKALFWQSDNGLLKRAIPIFAEQVILSPDQQTLATTGVYVPDPENKNGWINSSLFTTVDANTGKVLHTLSVQPDRAIAVAFRPDGAAIGVSTSANSARLWEINSGKILQTFTTPGIMSDAALSPDGNILVLENYSQVSSWHVATGNKIAEISGFTSQIIGLAISPDGQKLVSGGDLTDDGHAILTMMDFNTHSVLYTVRISDNSDIGRVAFSPNGQYLMLTKYYRDFHRSIQILDSSTGQLIRELPENTSSAIYSPDGQMLVTVNDQQIQAWNAANNQSLYTLNDSQAFIYAIAISPDSSTLATSRKAENIKLWDLKTGRFIRELPVKSEQIAFHPNGNILAVAVDYALELINIKTDQVVWKSPEEYPDYALFSTNGQKVFSKNYDDNIRIWDTASGQVISSFGAHDIFSLVIHPNNHTLITSGPTGQVCIWEMPGN